MQIRVKQTKTGTEVFTASEVKTFLKVDFDADDTTIAAQIKAARKLCEKYIDSTIVNKTLVVDLYDFQDWDYAEDGSMTIELPQGPHIAVSEVVRIIPGQADTTLTVDSDYYVLGQDDKRVKIVNKAVSTVAGYKAESYKITLTAGMSDAVDEDLLEGIKKTLADMYENRGNTVIGTIQANLTWGARTLWNPHRRTIL